MVPLEVSGIIHQSLELADWLKPFDATHWHPVGKEDAIIGCNHRLSISELEQKNVQTILRENAALARLLRSPSRNSLMR